VPTHDHATRDMLASEIDDTMVLVGESGGLSAVYDSEESLAMPGVQLVTTEHGPLYLDPGTRYAVLDTDAA
jgi:hypothetical protein